MRRARVVTHSRPDADALVSAYLAQRFLGDTAAPIEFVSRDRGRRFALDLDNSDCLVDVGNCFDPARLRFDHKPPAFIDRNSTCATRLVHEYLLACGHNIAAFAPLVAIIHEGDHNPPARPSLALLASRASGFHAHIKAAQENLGDAALYAIARLWLDTHG